MEEAHLAATLTFNLERRQDTPAVESQRHYIPGRVSSCRFAACNAALAELSECHA